MFNSISVNDSLTGKISKTTTSMSDADAITETGLYTVGTLLIFHMRYSAEFMVQFRFAYGTTDGAYTIRQKNGTTWSSWFAK